MAGTEEKWAMVTNGKAKVKTAIVTPIIFAKGLLGCSGGG